MDSSLRRNDGRGQCPPPFTGQVNGQHCQLTDFLDILSPGQPHQPDLGSTGFGIGRE
jgi:hypothetical protein